MFPGARLRLRFFQILLLTVFLTSSLKSQDASCLNRSTFVGAFDKKGLAIKSLAKDDLRAEYRGEPVEILSVVPDDRPRQLILLIDASNSMTGTLSELEVEQMLAADFVRFAPSNSTLALLVFASEVKEKVSFSPNRSLVASKVANLKVIEQKISKAHRKTALFGSILEALREFHPPQAGDAIYVITDGGDKRTPDKASQVEKALLSSGIRLFVFLLLEETYSRGRTRMDAEGPRKLLEIVRHTGGSMLSLGFDEPFARNLRLSDQQLTNLVLAARQLYQVMAQPYRVNIRLPRPVDKPRDWKLEALKADGKPDRNVYLYYPRLVPCASDQGAQLEPAASTH